MGSKLRKMVIDSTKNVYQFDFAIATNSVHVEPIAIAVPPASIDETDVAKVANVEEGAEIKAIDLNFRLFSASTVTGSLDQATLCLRKNEGLASLGLPTVAQMQSLGAQVWKSRIFHIDQAIPGQTGGMPMSFPPIIIPKRFRVMHANDKWELVIANVPSAAALSMQCCGRAIYKWYK